jgi:dihydrolipoamide dehydrogenase
MLDKQIAKKRKKFLAKQGLIFVLGAKVTATSVNDGVVTVTYQDKDGEKTADFDKLIVAVGRRPYAQGLLAEDSGIAQDERGFVMC